jgi:hypothetical protein
MTSLDKKLLKERAPILITILIVSLLVIYFASGPPTPKTREQRIESQFSAWDGSHRKLERYVKSQMNDPGSYEHVKTKYRIFSPTSEFPGHIVVSTTYRGKNVFGGVVSNTTIAVIDMNGNVKKILY